jgi:CRP/FNR family transcriptional regulator, cyclic AMP receptor protein
VSVLEVDPELGADLLEDDRQVALSVCRGELVGAPAGPWSPSEVWSGRDHPLAFVLGTGVLCRELSFAGRRTFELLGPGDVVAASMPDDDLGSAGAFTFTASENARLLVLGATFTRAAARWPELLTRLLSRLEAQRRRLAVQSFISHLPRAEDRVLVMLWHLGQSWGQVTGDGLRVQLALTHELLAHLIGARRPTVTLAVASLQSSGHVKRIAGGSWLLTSTGIERAQAITDRAANPQRLGQTFVTHQRSLEVRKRADDLSGGSHALRAEANQLRANLNQPSRPGRREP